MEEAKLVLKRSADSGLTDSTGSVVIVWFDVFFSINPYKQWEMLSIAGYRGKELPCALLWWGLGTSAAMKCSRRDSTKQL